MRELAIARELPSYSLDPPLRSFSRHQAIKHMLQVWGGLLPSEHLHVLTVPPSDAACW